MLFLKAEENSNLQIHILLTKKASVCVRSCCWYFNSLSFAFAFKWPSFRWHNHDSVKQGSTVLEIPKLPPSSERCPCGTVRRNETRLAQVPKVVYLPYLFHTWEDPRWHQHRNVGTRLHYLLCFSFRNSCKAGELPVSHSAAHSSDLGDHCSWRHGLKYENNDLLLKFNPWRAGFTELHVWLCE